MRDLLNDHTDIRVEFTTNIDKASFRLPDDTVLPYWGFYTVLREEYGLTKEQATDIGKSLAIIGDTYIKDMAKALTKELNERLLQPTIDE